MNRLRQGLRALLCVLVAVLLSAVGDSSTASNFEIDTVATVIRIIDGDTFDAVPVGRVRLADVDTPEIRLPGAREATAYLKSLVHGREVYLDTDNLHHTDHYDRVVAVAYIRHNDTHLLNVNAALVNSGFAAAWDLHNDFDPDTWSKFVYYPSEVEPKANDADWMRAEGAVMMFGILAAFSLAYPLLRRR